MMYAGIIEYRLYYMEYGIIRESLSRVSLIGLIVCLLRISIWIVYNRATANQTHY